MTDPTPEQVIKAASWAVPSGDLGAEFAEIVAALTAAGYSIVKLPSREQLWDLGLYDVADDVLALMRGESS
jgi:hypothetical protein